MPIGLVAGRLLFRTFADAVGTVPDASFPCALLGVVTLGMVTLANAVTVAPARVPGGRRRRHSHRRVGQRLS